MKEQEVLRISWIRIHSKGTLKRFITATKERDNKNIMSVLTTTATRNRDNSYNILLFILKYDHSLTVIKQDYISHLMYNVPLIVAPKRAYKVVELE
jgi:hypothetical protein